MGSTEDQESPLSQLHDSRSVYGWISILLHWISAGIIIALWIIGQNILNGNADNADATRGLHVSIAASAWLLIAARIIWRMRSGHPHVRGLSTGIHRIAKSAHYIMLVALATMLVSGPLLVWSGGDSIDVFGVFDLPSPMDASDGLREVAWLLHSNAAMVLLWLVLLHIGGALKHLMFHSDDTIIRILWPGKPAP